VTHLLDRLRSDELTLMMSIRSSRTPDAVRVAAVTGHQAVLIETPLGVANAEAIAALDGVDSLCIGANDFTAELGASRPVHLQF